MKSENTIVTIVKTVVTKALGSYPADETQVSHLYTGSYPFGHDPKLLTISEDRNKE